MRDCILGFKSKHKQTHVKISQAIESSSKRINVTSTFPPAGLVVIVVGSWYLCASVCERACVVALQVRECMGWCRVRLRDKEMGRGRPIGLVHNARSKRSTSAPIQGIWERFCVNCLCASCALHLFTVDKISASCCCWISRQSEYSAACANAAARVWNALKCTKLVEKFAPV